MHFCIFCRHSQLRSGIKKVIYVTQNLCHCSNCWITSLYFEHYPFILQTRLPSNMGQGFSWLSQEARRNQTSCTLWRSQCRSQGDRLVLSVIDRHSFAMKTICTYICDIPCTLYCTIFLDLTNPKTNTKTAGFTKEERENFTVLLDQGYIDTYRHFYPDRKNQYSFWSYRANARGKNVGW